MEPAVGQPLMGGPRQGNPPPMAPVSTPARPQASLLEAAKQALGRRAALPESLPAVSMQSVPRGTSPEQQPPATSDAMLREAAMRSLANNAQLSMTPRQSPANEATLL